MSSERRSRISAALRASLAVAMGAVLLSPAASSAQESDPESQRADVREREAQIDIEIDALQASAAQIDRALADLQRNVATKQAELAEAARAQRAADADVAEARAAVNEAQQRIDALDQATDQLVVEAFVNPPGGEALDAFTADNIADATVTQALLEMRAQADADLLDQLSAAHDDLEIEQANAEEAAAEAADRKQASEAALADLGAAMDQQQAFAAEVEQRLEQRLGEAAALQAVDAELSRQIEQEQALAAQQLRDLQAASEAAPAPTISEPSGGLATVTCPTGGSITVAGSIAQNVQGLLNLAGQQGVPLCGGGYRDPEEQIALREQNCGTSYYAIYEMPSSQCDPPTARPGTSLHEQGLAIDFTCPSSIVSTGDVCWNFLSANANSYGLYNYPPEPWHWSTTGG